MIMSVSITQLPAVRRALADFMTCLECLEISNTTQTSLDVLPAPDLPHDTMILDLQNNTEVVEDGAMRDEDHPLKMRGATTLPLHQAEMLLGMLHCSPHEARRQHMRAFPVARGMRVMATVMLAEATSHIAGILEGVEVAVVAVEVATAMMIEVW